MKTEEFEKICERVHNAWWEEKLNQGIYDHPDGIPYAKLSENIKDYDRVTVRVVLGMVDVPTTAELAARMEATK